MLLTILLLGVHTVRLRQLALHAFSPKPFTGGPAPRIIVFFCGVIESEIWSFALYDRPSSLQVMLRVGLEWVLLFEIVSRTRRWLRPSTVPLYMLAILVISPPLGAAIDLVPLIGEDDSFRDDIIRFLLDPLHWLPDLTIFPQNLGIVASAIATVLIFYFILYGTLPSKSKESELLTVWSGCMGGNMVPAKSQTTRLLCASAFLAGEHFREQILSHFKHESRGVAPELGVDIRLVAMVCQYARTREKRLELYMSIALLVSLILSVLNVFLGVLILFLIATAIHFTMTCNEHELALNFRKEHYDEAKVGELFTAQLEAKMVSALPREDQNLIVYTGFTPFVGAGIHLGGWSFVVDILKPCNTLAESGTTTPFTTEELYTEISTAISISHMEGLAIRDCYFVNGREIRENREILPDIYSHPIQYLDHDIAQRYRSDSDTRIRHYMWIRVHDWDQELVTSYLLRLSIRGRSLFVEINRLLLTPLSERYRRIDAMAPLRTIDLIGVMTVSALAGPLQALFSPFLMLRRLNEPIEKFLGLKKRAHRKNIERNLLFDYGAGQGHRQAFSSNQFEHFFQKADGDFYAKALESIILDKIISFLDEHHVDTSDLRERQNMIMNSGIIVHGGDVKAESLAVGFGARATKSHSFKSKAQGQPSEA